MVCATRYVDALFTWPAGEGLRRAVDGERVIPLLSISPRQIYFEMRCSSSHLQPFPTTYYNICKGEQGSVSIDHFGDMDLC